MPVAVIGCGRMGRLHAKVYSKLPGAKLIGVFDANADAAAAVADEFSCPVLPSLQAALASAKAISIVTPTAFHKEVALKAISAGIACLIEKPLARNVQECRDIAQAAEAAGVVIQVGHIERFNPAVMAMRRLNVSPRFIEVTRISPMTFRSIDVGVVLDMMIHDIDIVLTLARSEVVSVEAVGVGVIGGYSEDSESAGGGGSAGSIAEDVCNARIRFASGCVANLTASRLALKTERRLRVFSPDAYVSLDYQKKYGIVVRKGSNLTAIRDTVAQIRKGEIEDLSQINYADLLQVEELAIDDVEPLRAELDSFISAAKRLTPVEVSAQDGLAAVELAQRIVSEMQRQQL